MLHMKRCCYATGARILLESLLYKGNLAPLVMFPHNKVFQCVVLSYTPLILVLLPKFIEKSFCMGFSRNLDWLIPHYNKPQRWPPHHSL